MQPETHVPTPDPEGPDPETRAGAKRRQRAKAKALTFLRRVHLYSGLFLVPWVLLYGVSALLFNHPSWASTRSIEDLSPARIDFDVAEALDPARLAADVATALALEADAPRLADLRHPELTGPLYFRGDAEDLEGNAVEDVIVRVDLEGRGARAWRRPLRRDGSEQTLQLASLDVGRAELQALGGQVSGLLAPNAEAPLALGLRAAPTLRFEAALDGAPHTLRYDLRRGTLTAEPTDAPAPLTTSRLGRIAKDLHTEHGYLPWSSGETVWAGFVDLMGASMVLWGLTGLVMWWQLKRLRRVGAVALAASLASAAAVVVALWPGLA
ncbi:MAG: hypothetical protein AAFZ65_00685 [Planctomycetota bacterium]